MLALLLLPFLKREETKRIKAEEELRKGEPISWTAIPYDSDFIIADADSGTISVGTGHTGGTITINGGSGTSTTSGSLRFWTFSYTDSAGWRSSR